MSLASGVLSALSFPTVLFGWKVPNLGFLAWFGLVPLILVLKKVTPRQAFWRGFCTATISFVIGFYWIFIALHVYDGLSVVVSILFLVLLAVIEALYLGLACFLSVWVVQKRKGGLLFWLPPLWSLAEWVRGHIPFGGFPWNHLAISQSNYTPLIQIADLTGFYGVLFALVWFNTWLAEAWLKIKGERVTHFVPKTCGTLILICFVLGYGFYQTSSVQKESLAAPHLKVGLIQPNIPQEEKMADDFFPQHRRIFEEAVARLQGEVDLIVWPETSWPDTLWVDDQKVSPERFGVTIQRDDAKPYTLLGLSPLKFKLNQGNIYNSAVLLDARGLVLGKYHKVQLVPFGEYNPLKGIFPHLVPVATDIDFKPGEETIPLSLGRWSLAPLICYEDIFPQISQTMVRQGAHFLVNITNDAWYGLSSAAYQHLALAQFRAVETRRSMVRATNSGVTAIIDPTGKISDQLPWFERGLLTEEIPLLSKKTVYTSLGNWLGQVEFLEYNAPW